MKRIFLAVLPLVALAACGGGTSSPDVESGSDVAEAANCSGYTDDSDQMFVTDGGSCEVDGEEAFVYYFADNSNRDQWFDTASGLAGGRYLVGDHFVIQAKAATLKAMQGDLGGELKP